MQPWTALVVVTTINIVITVKVGINIINVVLYADVRVWLIYTKLTLATSLMRATHDGAYHLGGLHSWRDRMGVQSSIWVIRTHHTHTHPINIIISIVHVHVHIHKGRLEGITIGKHKNHPTVLLGRHVYLWVTPSVKPIRGSSTKLTPATINNSVNPTNLLWDGDEVNGVIGKGRKCKGGLPSTLTGKRDDHVRRLTRLEMTVQHILTVWGVLTDVYDFTMQVQLL